MSHASLRVALFMTCFDDMLFPWVGAATVRLLEANGCEVVFPADQTCCGQLHFNTGYRDACVPLVHNFVGTFGELEVDAIVTPSASCAAMVRHHHATVAAHAGDKALGSAVQRVGQRVYELTEFIVDRLGLASVGSRFPHAVAFHPTCHSTRLLGIGDRPLRLLAGVEGLRLVDLPGADACCGFGGTFAIKNEATSVAMGLDKVAAIEASGAEVLTAADDSCLLHIGGLLSRRGSRVRVMHLAEILASGSAA